MAGKTQDQDQDPDQDPTQLHALPSVPRCLLEVKE